MAVSRLSIGGQQARNLGLKDQELGRLGKLVVLAGRNGSGKSRILQYMIDHVNFVFSRGNARRDLESRRDSIVNAIELERSQDPSDEQRISDLRSLVEGVESQLEVISSVQFDGEQGAAIVFTAVPGNLLNPAQMTRQAIFDYSKKLRGIDGGDWGNSVLAYISQLQDAWRECTHQDSIHSPEVIADAENKYRSLNSVVEAFFGEALGRSVAGEVTLFGQPLAEVKFSSGQKVALQMITALHAKAPSLGHSILVMDEPENHLHPAALVELLKSISAHAPDVQIWIATHSVPLLAYINATQSNAVWMVDEGKAEFAGKRPEEVLQHLLGAEDQIAHLVSFLSLPHNLAVNNYAFECLLPPTVVFTGGEDDQLQQIRRVLSTLREDGVLRVVDYGAGKGRLVEALHSAGLADQIFDYVAYDKFDSDADYCRSVIEGHFGNSDGRYFNKVDKLLAAKGEGWADCVVMTNVLHELPVADWKDLFSGNSLLGRVLKPNGYLLVVEDQEIPVGELAHQDGFILLNTTELRRLFSAEDPGWKEEFLLSNSARDGRLTAHLVARSAFDRVSAKSRERALEGVKAHAIEEIQALREKGTERSYRNGMRHAFWTQQLANAVLALKAF